MNKYSLIFVILAVLFFSAVFRAVSDFVYLFFLLVWLFYNKIKKIDGKFSIIAGLILLSFCPFVLNSDSQLSQRFAGFAFLFLISGVYLLFSGRGN